MEEMLLFQVGTHQLGMDLAYIKSIQSAKPNISEREGEHTHLTQVVDGKEIPLYDLLSVFEKDTAMRKPDGEKVIAVESHNHPMGLIVNRINQVVPVDSDRIKPLSSIFRGSSLACFPKVLKHDDRLILLFTPEGLNKIDQQVPETQNDSDRADSQIASHTIKVTLEQAEQVAEDSSQDQKAYENRCTSEICDAEPNEEILLSDFIPSVETEERLNPLDDAPQITDIEDDSETKPALPLTQEEPPEESTAPQTDLVVSSVVNYPEDSNVALLDTDPMEIDPAQLVSDVRNHNGLEIIQEHAASNIDSKPDSQPADMSPEPSVDFVQIEKKVTGMLQEDLLAAEVEEITTQKLKKFKLTDKIDRIFTQAIEDLRFKINKKRSTMKSQVNHGIDPKYEFGNRKA